MRFRVVLLLVVVLVITGVGVATWRGSGPLPDPERCTARVGGHSVAITVEQAENATLIAAIGVCRGLPARAVSIALATAYQESKIRNLRHGDRDSLGLFQQRPSQGWGTAREIRDRHYAINAFYDALEKVPDYKSMRITEAAQTVQRSGFPEAYEQHAEDARALASALTGYSPGGLFSCVVHESSRRGTAEAVVTELERAYGDLDVSRTGTRQDLTVGVPADEGGYRLGWSVAQFVVAHGTSLHPQRVGFAGKRWRTGRASERGWTRAPANEDTRLTVVMG